MDFPLNKPSIFGYPRPWKPPGHRLSTSPCVPSQGVDAVAAAMDACHRTIYRGRTLGATYPRLGHWDMSSPPALWHRWRRPIPGKCSVRLSLTTKIIHLDMLANSMTRNFQIQIPSRIKWKECSHKLLTIALEPLQIV